MTPYLGADVLVSVDAAHNNGSPVAPAKITAVHPDGTVNVRVTYDGPPSHQHPLGHHRPEWLTGVLFHDTTDPAAAMRLGLYGAFWPPGSALALIAEIIENQEKIMTAQQDIDAAVAAIGAVAADLTSAASAISAEVANLNAELAAAGSSTVDTTALNTAVTALQTAQAAVDALEPAPAPAAPAEPAPAPSEPAAPVASGDGGTAS